MYRTVCLQRRIYVDCRQFRTARIGRGSELSSEEERKVTHRTRGNKKSFARPNPRLVFTTGTHTEGTEGLPTWICYKLKDHNCIDSESRDRYPNIPTPPRPAPLPCCSRAPYSSLRRSDRGLVTVGTESNMF